MSKKKRRHRDPRRPDSPDHSGDKGDLTRTLPFALPYGAASAVLRDGVLLSVEWEKSRIALEEALSEKFPGAKVIDHGMCEAGKILHAYSTGQPVAPESVATLRVDWEQASPFQRVVLKELAKVPYGRTITYGELAARSGRRKAARAVGAALSRNPWPVILPCHRVVGAGGKMIGFGKGIDAKRILLSFEEKNATRAKGCPRKRQTV
jgi:methylated-DNA-[protein]-cysteine S-methyltransferase